MAPRSLLAAAVVGLLAAPAAAQPKPFGWRTADGRTKLFQSGGGSADSAQAIARGLEYLAAQQKKDGSWSATADSRDPVGDTALALLPFVAAGYTHKPGPDKAADKYRKTVESGLAALLSGQQANGRFGGRGAGNTTSHAQATVVVCELSGMAPTDPRVKRSAQAAVTALMAAQADDGAWSGNLDGKGGGSLGATEWPLQAMEAAKAAGLKLDADKAYTKLRRFLRDAADPETPGGFGNRTPPAGQGSTVIGLYARSLTDGWGPGQMAFDAGVKFALTPPDDGMVRRPPGPGMRYDVARLLYLTGSDAWAGWNEATRETLVKTQVTDDKEVNGSWQPVANGGRLAATALNVLTLQTCYRYPPAPPTKK